MKIKTRTLTTIEREGVITAEAIRAALGLPADAVITFDVPGGGDYSNMRLDVAEHPLTAFWKITDIRDEQS